jgi:hypothetical protein
MNLHYGCGLDTGEGWYNCDASPTLRLQRLPMIGWAFKKWLKPRFPETVFYGDIARGMDLPPNSCETIFCSHILEHLALEDLRIALRNTHHYLKFGGVFRLVVPDFEQLVKAYQAESNPEALSHFLSYSFLGRHKRPKGFTSFLREYFGNSHHLWMWDEKGMVAELQQAGFTDIRRCQVGDSTNKAFLAVENPERFVAGLAIECSK